MKKISVIIGIWIIQQCISTNSSKFGKKAESILGPDIVLWRSNFQLKLPLSQQDEWDTGVPWHQDSAYFQPSPNVILSAWIAIDHVEKSNGCMQILSGSHKKLCPHIQNDSLKMFEKTADIDAFEPNNSIFIELNPGEFIFLIHFILATNKSETEDLESPQADRTS